MQAVFYEKKKCNRPNKSVVILIHSNYLYNLPYLNRIKISVQDGNKELIVIFILFVYQIGFIKKFAKVTVITL